ncbi:HisA/HisF-related TIM barrel protein [Candidatus Vidania fulgoroideorum]
MIIIPALDIYKNNIVRLTKGNYNKVFKLKKSINKILDYFLKNKFNLINIIDLEGALKKKITNKKKIVKLISFFLDKKIKCCIGGGIRNKKSIKYYISKGAHKIILGTKILKNINFFREIYNKYKKKILISIDIYKNKIMINGWKKKNKISLKKYLKKISFYKKKIIFTNINRDGTLKGVDIKFIKNILNNNLGKKRCIFSGGFSGEKDIIKIKNECGSLFGYIVGKYIYNKI